MAYINVPEGLPGIVSLLAFRPETAKPLGEIANALLRGPSTLSPGERELIAAYVSARNDCTFCKWSHAAIAACHLESAQAVADAIRDPETAPISGKMKALLALAARVQTSGRDVRDSDIERARREGATDVEIHDAVLIAAAFCMFNRYVDGLAAYTPTDPQGYRDRAHMIAERGYASSPAISGNDTQGM